MQTLLGLLLFSLLLTRGASLQCQICTAIGGTCSSDNVECAADQDTCVLLEYGAIPPKVNVSTISKGCATMADCESMKKQIGAVVSIGKIQKVECNKAPAAAASLLLAFSSLLSMKILL